MNMNETLFWNNVNALAKQQGKPLKDVAEQCSLNYGTFKNQMSKKVTPNVLEAIKIAQSLNTTVEYLVTGERSADRAMALKAELQAVLDRY